MTMLMAIAHLIGAFVALVILWVMGGWFAAWWDEKSQASAAEELSVALGVTVEKLKTEEMVPQVLKVQGERFSSELLRNRLSDLCGWIRAAFGWIASLLVIGVLLAIGWLTFSETRENAVYAWVVIPMQLVFAFLDIAFMLSCRLFTGRYPGQARHARKELANYIKTHKAASDL